MHPTLPTRCAPPTMTTCRRSPRPRGTRRRASDMSVVLDIHVRGYGRRGPMKGGGLGPSATGRAAPTGARPSAGGQAPHLPRHPQPHHRPGAQCRCAAASTPLRPCALGQGQPLRTRPDDPPAVTAGMPGGGGGSGCGGGGRGHPPPRQALHAGVSWRTLPPPPKKQVADAPQHPPSRAPRAAETAAMQWCFTPPPPRSRRPKSAAAASRTR